MAADGMRSAQTIDPDRKVRRRREWEDTRRPAWVMWLSVACLVGLAATVIALAGSDRMSTPQAINGDVLGPDNDEPLEDYVRRAGESLDGMTGEDERWALVTPQVPAGPEMLADIFRGQAELRVSTLLAGGLQWPVPEPADGFRRADVFDTARGQMAQNAGTGTDDDSLNVLGVLVHGAPEHLRTVDDSPDVLAVEVLPPDAAHGRFGLRPVTPE